MKKTLLLLATALFSATAFAQTVTKVSPDGSDNQFKLPANSHVYAIFEFSDGLKQKLGIDDSHYTYIGEDKDAGRDLWNWNTDGGGVTDATGKDSFGEDGQYLQLDGANGWSGWGLHVDKANPIDLSGMFDPNAADADKYGLHFAIRQTKRSTGSTPAVTITDGNGTSAEFKFGTGRGQLNVPADGNWYSIDISCFDLLDNYGVDFSTAANKTYSDKNLFTFAWGAAPDDFSVDYAAFFYGPGDASTGINEIKTADKEDANAPVYNLAGQRVSNPQHGLFIKNGKKFIVK